MSVRRRLPKHRWYERLTFTLGGFNTAGIGCFDDSVGEKYLDASAKSGTAVEAAARDAAVTASIALQHGTPVETIRHAFSQDHRGRAAGPLGALLDILAEENARE